MSLVTVYVNTPLLQACPLLTVSACSFLLFFLVIHCFFQVLGEILGFMIASQTCCCLGPFLKLIPLPCCNEKFSTFRKCRARAAIKIWQKSVHLRIFNLKMLLNNFSLFKKQNLKIRFYITFLRNQTLANYSLGIVYSILS